MGVPKIRGTFFVGPHIKDYRILGSILRSPYFWKLPYGSCSTRGTMGSPGYKKCMRALVGSWQVVGLECPSFLGFRPAFL